MLAKHYYQAASASADFFAPANEPDISYYNEFMSYLGEKQRVAVVKLDERNTLFLVPPSEFSEKVLKVPGKVCISGVVLRLDPPGSSHGFLPPNENQETPFNSFQNDSVYQNSVSPSGPYLPPPPPFISDMRSVDSQLASSLIGQKRQLSGVSGSGEYKPSGGNMNQQGYQSQIPPNYGLPNDQMSTNFPPPKYDQVRQLLQQSPNLVASQREPQLNQQQHLQIAGQNDADTDPQKRLEATLHLAAALIQQIQQGKGT